MVQHPDRPARVLLMEDDRDLSALLCRLLGPEGYRVEPAHDGQSGLHLGLTREYDAIVRDRGLPVLEGLDLLGDLRQSRVRTPVLVLTGRGTAAGSASSRRRSPWPRWWQCHWPRRPVSGWSAASIVASAVWALDRLAARRAAHMVPAAGRLPAADGLEPGR